MSSKLYVALSNHYSDFYVCVKKHLKVKVNQLKTALRPVWFLNVSHITPIISSGE